MHDDVAIRVSGLSKKYRITHGLAQGPVTLRETLSGAIRSAPGRALALARRNGTSPNQEDFWALRDLNFEVKVGDIVGVIGRNGAGKSTLLKVLSRITEPTAGRIEIRGRVASLLEVGTGFHPELTGRENIFLNGAILGMARAEIASKFDEIVAFAEIERFLDTPVKRYSSGMYMRLAFSVAAHLEPEVLVIDEVLAVGDAAFQRKCLGKMSEVAGQGRTVLFVSHNMNATERLCNKAIVLRDGSIVHMGDNVGLAIANYLGNGDAANVSNRTVWKRSDEGPREPVDHLRVDELRVTQDSARSEPAADLSNQYPIRVTLSGQVFDASAALTIGIALFSSGGELLFWSYSTDTSESSWPSLHVGPFSLSCEIPARLLNEGVYRLEYISSLHFQRWIQAPSSGGPHIEFGIRGGLSDSPIWSAPRPGLLAPVLQWTRENA